MRYMQSRLASVITFCFALLLSFSSAAGPAAPSEYSVVTVPVANMYSSGSTNVDVVSQAIFGTNVTVLELRGDWAHVRTPDQYTGWMQVSQLLKLKDGRAYASQSPAMQVESLFANLYRETDVTLHQPLLTVPFETRLELVSEQAQDEGRWLQVRLPDGREAWIQSGDVTQDPKALTIDDSITLGKRFLGLPYLWGGRSSYGYDCSGFTQMLVRSRGINMPRDADLQAAWDGMEIIDRKDLRAGDLLFFGRSADKITHTAMFIGDGQFIQATTHGRPVIQISRLDDQPWTRLLVACRRVK